MKLGDLVDLIWDEDELVMSVDLISSGGVSLSTGVWKKGQFGVLIDVKKWDENDFEPRFATIFVPGIGLVQVYYSFLEKIN